MKEIYKRGFLSFIIMVISLLGLILATCLFGEYAGNLFSGDVSLFGFAMVSLSIPIILVSIRALVFGIEYLADERMEDKGGG